MPDVVDAATRSRMMAGIRGKDTKPELIVRRALHARGFRYRLHNRKLPGSPDLCFPKYRAVIFVHGCFWHGHGCHLFKMPSTRTDFWASKIKLNAVRDQDVRRLLKQIDWRQLTIWECALKGRTRLDVDALMSRVANWLDGDQARAEIGGR